jgi:hypothetical protein
MDDEDSANQPGPMSVEIDSYGPPGPYGTEIDAIAAARQRRADTSTTNNDAKLNRLLTAADHAHVEVGSYDLRVLNWLACAEPQIVEVVAALIDRAAESNVIAFARPRRD